MGRWSLVAVVWLLCCALLAEGQIRPNLSGRINGFTPVQQDCHPACPSGCKEVWLPRTALQCLHCYINTSLTTQGVWNPTCDKFVSYNVFRTSHEEPCTVREVDVNNSLISMRCLEYMRCCLFIEYLRMERCDCPKLETKCTSNDTCAGDYVCRDGKCVQTKLGDFCDTPRDCPPGSDCVDDLYADRVCRLDNLSPCVNSTDHSCLSCEEESVACIGSCDAPLTCRNCTVGVDPDCRQCTTRPAFRYNRYGSKKRCLPAFLITLPLPPVPLPPGTSLVNLSIVPLPPVRPGTPSPPPPPPPLYIPTLIINQRYSAEPRRGSGGVQLQLILPIVLVGAAVVVTVCLVYLHWRKWRGGESRATELLAVMDLAGRDDEEQLTPDNDFIEQMAAFLNERNLTGPNLPVARDTGEAWTVVREIGRGSFGTVYQAATMTGKHVAVKVLQVGEGSLGAMKSELDLVSRLRHANIVSYLGAEAHIATSRLFIFMEYLSTSLTKFVRSAGRLDEKVASAYTRQILEGLCYLHEHSIVHRDIKGDNILLDEVRSVVKIADFGCSKELDPRTLPIEGLTSIVCFMAPEVLRPQGKWSPTADIWSVGCVVVQMLNHGEPPWPPFDSPFHALYVISECEGLPPNIPKNVSTETGRFFEATFTRNPSERPLAAQLLDHPFVKRAPPLARRGDTLMVLY